MVWTICSPAYGLRLAEAVQARADAEAALDTALDTLADLERDHSQRLADAMQDKADAERSLELAAVELERYEDANEALNGLRQDKIEAEATLAETQQHLASLRLAQERDGLNLRSHIQRWEFLEEIRRDTLDDVQGRVAEVEQLEANVESFQAELDQFRIEITRMEDGLDPLARTWRPRFRWPGPI